MLNATTPSFRITQKGKGCDLTRFAVACYLYHAAADAQIFSLL